MSATGGDPASGLRLRWRRTWPDQPQAQDDYIGRPRDRASPHHYVRIMLDTTTPDQHGRWSWAAAAERNAGCGWEDDARAAAAAGEAAYWRRRAALDASSADKVANADG